MMVSGAIVPAGGIELATEDLALQQTTNSTLVRHHRLQTMHLARAVFSHR